MDFDPIALANEVPDERSFDRAVIELLDAAFIAIKQERATVVNVDAKRLDAAIAHLDYVD